MFTVVTPGLLQKKLSKKCKVREGITVRVTLFCDTFCSIFICFYIIFWQQKWISVIRVCRCSLFSVWGLTKVGKSYIYNYIFSSKYSKKAKNIFYCREKPHILNTDLKNGVPNIISVCHRNAAILWLNKWCHFNYLVVIIFTS